jgi:rod shape determining protein RodA
VLGGIVLATDHRWLRIWAPVLYLGSLAGLALIFVPGVGSTVNGSHSWLMVGGLSIQPAELAKVGVIVGMALVLAERAEGRLRTSLSDSDLVPALLIAAVPAALILMQPDLGTAMVLTAIVFGIVALAGAPKRWLVGLLAVGVGTIAVAIALGVLEEYQLLRFRAFTDPALDPKGAGYNTIQARVAIGNGGVFGQGLFDGSQTRAGFVPEQHTDFVFTVAGEELGLIGAAAIILLFAVVLWRALRIASAADDIFGRLAAVGVACWFGFQAFQNIGMCLGIMPVTGVPLPLVSYGGTSMFASLIGVGLLQNIHLRADRRLGLGIVVRSHLVRSAEFGSQRRAAYAGGVTASEQLRTPMPVESLFPRLEPLLPRVGKPIQYVGGELNSTIKDWDSVDVRWALMYPDAYEVGLPNQGVAILYEILNERDWILGRAHLRRARRHGVDHAGARDRSVHGRQPPAGVAVRPARPQLLHRARLHQHAHRPRPCRHPAARRRPRRVAPGGAGRRALGVQPEPIADFIDAASSATARRSCSRSARSCASGRRRVVPAARAAALATSCCSALRCPAASTSRSSTT